MNTKDNVIGTAKQIIAEIARDGRLAEEGARQTSEIGLRPAAEPATEGPRPQEQAQQSIPTGVTTWTKTISPPCSGAPC